MGGGSSTDSARSSSTRSLSFEQYCISLSTLIIYGTATQQFECEWRDTKHRRILFQQTFSPVARADLFHTYAVESERGITRAEIFQMLQDHYSKRADHRPQHAVSKKKSDAEPDSDSRHFERLYTWLKKHMGVYDKARSGFLSCKIALDMLHAHPSALQHLQLQIDPFIKRMDENNTKYRDKATAAQVD